MKRRERGAGGGEHEDKGHVTQIQREPSHIDAAI